VKSRWLPTGILAVLMGCIVLAWWVGGRSPGLTGTASDGWRPATLLGGAADPGFARVTDPAPFRFPADHGPHPDYRHEWWYLTANLATGDGRRFGVQLTLFRFALAPPIAPGAADSAWRSREVYMAHLALTDVTGRRFHAWERFARPVLGMAGARAEPFRVWLEDWVLESAAAGRLFPLRLQAAEGSFAIELELEPRKPLVEHGDGGVSRKGAEPGNASRYYAFTRLAARGRLTLPDGVLEVSGSAWLDREWGTSALGPGAVGWDWFALQLDDGRDLMLYQLRHADGSRDPYSAGSLVAADGSVTALAATQFSIEPRGSWRAADGTRYPARWRLRVPDAAIDLDVEPLLANQELDLSVRYWEGAVRVVGSARGYGYAELTGYAGVEPLRR